jgi:signal transduction histidine kinase
LNETRLLGFGRRGSIVVHTDFAPSKLFPDASGTIWSVGGPDIYQLRGNQFQPLPLHPGEARNLVDITIDTAGTVWAYDAQSGLLRLAGDVLEQVAAITHPQYGSYTTLFSDSRGRVWIALYDRVAFYDHGRLRIFDEASGEAPIRVRDFFEDSSGDIWAVGSGIGKLDGDRFRVVSPLRVAGANYIFGIAQDDGDAWWIVTDAGLLRVPPGELDRAMADTSHAIQYRVYERLDGLPGTIDQATIGKLIAKTPDGRIWTATDGGLASVDPANLPAAFPPAVLIETVRIDGRELLPSQNLRIPPGSGAIEIDYTAMTLATPERVRFRYRLEREDRTWQEVGTRRRAYYTQLPPGTHRFHVTASSDDGVWNEAGAVLTFIVLPAWYQTLWFRLAVILLIGGLGAAAAGLVQRKRHLRSHEALKARYEATMAERTRIAQDLHDTLLQGFAGVALQLKTAELALPDRPDVAADTLVRVQRLTRESLMEARERVWEMHGTELQGRDLPDALQASARDRTAGTGIEVAVITTGERRPLDHRIEDAAFRIAREAVANAVQHADARRIEIHVAFAATALRVEVRDDGRGMTTEQLDKARLTGHFGLSGIRDRAERAGGHCDVLAPPDGGTVVVLELPLGASEAD